MMCRTSASLAGLCRLFGPEYILDEIGEFLDRMECRDQP